MFERLKKAGRVNAKDEALLAEHRARDADLGAPTKETLTERAQAAVLKGYWKAALSSYSQGADVNAPIKKKDTGGDSNAYTLYPAVFFAVEQNQPAVLKQLLSLGADLAAVGVWHSWLYDHTKTLLEHATREGTVETMAVLLQAGIPSPQEKMNGALEIAAKDPDRAGIVSQLLAHGAKGYEAALRVAEKAGNTAAIRLIRAAEKAESELPSVKPAAPGPARQEPENAQSAFEAALGKATAEDRREQLARLREKFTADFDAVAVPPPAPVISALPIPAAPADPLAPRPKPLLNM